MIYPGYPFQVFDFGTKYGNQISNKTYPGYMFVCPKFTLPISATVCKIWNTQKYFENAIWALFRNASRNTPKILPGIPYAI